MKPNLQREQIIKRAQESPWIADFEITIEEIENNIININKIFKAKDNCANSVNQVLCGNNGYHFKLIKDQQGQIILVTYPCPRNILNKGFLIKNNFIYSSINLELEKQLLNKNNILIDVDENQKYRISLINFLLRIKRNEILPKGFYIQGNIGTGKSYLVLAFANEMALQNKKIGYILMNNFSLFVMQNVKQQKDFSELIENFKTVDILIIDELGSEKYNSYIHNQLLYSILNHRLHTNKITIFCSKYTLNELKKVYKNTSNDGNIENYIERINNLCKQNIFSLRTKIVV